MNDPMIEDAKWEMEVTCEARLESGGRSAGWEKSQPDRTLS